jgi:hypothetical protein
LIKNSEFSTENLDILKKIQHYSAIRLFSNLLSFTVWGYNPLCISPFKFQRALRGTFHQNGGNRALGDKGPFLAEAETNVPIKYFHVNRAHDALALGRHNLLTSVIWRTILRMTFWSEICISTEILESGGGGGLFGFQQNL